LIILSTYHKPYIHCIGCIYIGLYKHTRTYMYIYIRKQRERERRRADWRMEGCVIICSLGPRYEAKEEITDG